MKLLLFCVLIVSFSPCAFAAQENPTVSHDSPFRFPLNSIQSEGDKPIVVDSASSGNRKISIVEIYKQGHTPESEHLRAHGTIYVYFAPFYLELDEDGTISRSDVMWGTRLEIVAISDKKCWIASDSLKPRYVEEIYEIDLRKALPRSPESLPREPLLDFFDKCGLLFSRPGNRVSYSVSEDGETLILTPHKPGMQPEDFPVKEFVYKASPEQAENEARSNPSGNREDPKSGHRAPRRKRATGDLTPEDAKKLNFLWENLSPEALKEIEDLTPREILSKYSGYLSRNKTWKVAPAEINRVRERIKSKKLHVREQGTIPPEYRSNKQTCTWALSCLPQIYSYAIGTIKGQKVGPPDVCIEDNDFFYMWLKEQPEKGEMIEKKTFKVYSWTFNEIEGPSENDSRSR